MDEEPRLESSAHAVFRGVNERLYALDLALGAVEPDIALVCECSQLDCVERIVVRTAWYEGLRLDAQTVIVVLGHPAHGERAAGDGVATYEVVHLQPG